MPRGKQTITLTAEQVALLEEFRKSPHEGAAAGYSVAQLRKAMSLPFSTETLGKALRGLPIWDLHHSWLASWIERYLRPKSQEPSGDESKEKEAGTDRTVRGSR